MDSNQNQRWRETEDAGVATGSKMWFGVEVRLNGQRHNPGWIQLKTRQVQGERWRENIRILGPPMEERLKDVRKPA